MRLTSVDLPAPFGPIRPTTSRRCSSSVTSSSACTPSNERETERARSDPCGAGLSAGGVRVSPWQATAVTSERPGPPQILPGGSELGDDLGRDRPDDLLLRAGDLD